MNNLSVFNFENSEVRFVDGKPVASDVAKVLGYAYPKSAINKKVSEKNKGVVELATPGGIQSVIVLEESGIYQLIFSSKLESAQKFQDWVFEEVLPQIRKTGSYENQNIQLEIFEMLKNQQEGLNKLLAEKTEKEIYGDLIQENFTGISKLLQSVLEGLQVQYREVIQNLYDKQSHYTLERLAFFLFSPNHYPIYCKARCNINGLYRTMTEKLLPKDGMNYVFDKESAIFAVWRLHFAALELGIIDNTANQYNEVIEELNSLLNK
jgi:prophage antirepressor-like protein